MKAIEPQRLGHRWILSLITVVILCAAAGLPLHAAEISSPVVDAENVAKVAKFDPTADHDAEVERLLAAMTLDEKIGQMCQVWPETGALTPALQESLHKGEIGSLINCASPELIADAQRLVREESRLGIPLLIGRDVVHGYRTIFPIPLGQAASWNPELIERSTAIAADEARGLGVNWTFAPMVDVCRDPRWGRIAETLGEDPYLSGELAAAMVRGFQQEREGQLHGLLACAKHFAA
jgi:beta-glucosidase